MLNGIEGPVRRLKGGIRRIQLIPAAAVEGAAYDSEKDLFSEFTTGTPPVEFAFSEDEACYVENVGFGRGRPLVHHQLRFSLPAGTDSRRAVDELLQGNEDGYVAVVTFASGEVRLIGYSLRFGGAFPLRMTGCDGSSESAQGQYPHIDIELASVDTEFARLVTL